MKYFRQPDSKGVLCPVIIRTPQTFFLFLYFFVYLIFGFLTIYSFKSDVLQFLKKKNLTKCNLGDISSLSLLLRKKKIPLRLLVIYDYVFFMYGLAHHDEPSHQLTVVTCPS